ncbi:MAG: hypothetical protein J4G09_11310 [Proteobacteria bacterium]|nr:hypothetical protein [Pseudomonadota bacterium]
MSVESHITYYNLMPIPPVESQTEYFDAGAIRIGVEYRLVNDAISAATEVARARGEDEAPPDQPDDRGVSIHVFAVRGGELWEHLRFDCFQEDPHYHYVSWEERRNEMLHLDPVADGDSVAWAIERLRTRLPQMLERAGAADAARALDPGALEAVLPKVAEAAYRARYNHDEQAVLRGALGGAEA